MAAPSQNDVLAALQSQSSFRAKNPPKTVPHAELAATAPDSLTKAPAADSAAAGSSSRTNSRKLYCPRDGCSSVIIGPGAAEWTEAEAALIPAHEGSPFTNTDSRGYWYINGSPFAFDNIGFSKAVGDDALPAAAPGVPGAPGRVKWLICAECDLGPLGWSFEGGKEAWLAADRLRYEHKE